MTTLAAARDALSAAGEVRRAAEGDHARATAEVVALVRRDDARIPRADGNRNRHGTGGCSAPGAHRLLRAPKRASP